MEDVSAQNLFASQPVEIKHKFYFPKYDPHADAHSSINGIIVVRLPDQPNPNTNSRRSYCPDTQVDSGHNSSAVTE